MFHPFGLVSASHLSKSDFPRLKNRQFDGIFPNVWCDALAKKSRTFTEDFRNLV